MLHPEVKLKSVISIRQECSHGNAARRHDSLHMPCRQSRRGRAVTDKRIKMLHGYGTSKGIIVHLPALAVTLVVTFLIAIFITFLKLT